MTIDFNTLPKLNDKQDLCLKRYLSNGFKKSEAYRYAYDCSNMSAKAIYVEASRFFSHPKITLWLQYYRENVQISVNEELKYTAIDYFNECEELKLIALECSDKFGNPNVLAAIKADENKAKAMGLFKDTENTNNVVVNMSDVSIDGEKIKYKLGGDVQDDSQAS